MYRFANHSPVAALGQANVKALAGNAAQWATTFNLGASHGFSVGNLAFIRNAAGTVYQYLGPVRAAASTTITTTYPVTAAIDTGTLAQVWRPTYSVAFPWGVDGDGLGSGRSAGVQVVGTRGGAAYSIKSADSAENVTMNFLARASVASAWRAFLRDRLGDGIGNCTLAWWSVVDTLDEANVGEGAPRCAVVKVASPDLAGAKRGPFVGFSVGFRVVADNSYL